MKLTNSDLADFRARKREHTFAFPPPRESHLFPEPQENEWGLFKAAAIVFILIVALIALVSWARKLGGEIRDDEFTRNTVAECTAQGRYPHVERDAAQKVLAVRCDATAEDAK